MSTSNQTTTPTDYDDGICRITVDIDSYAPDWQMQAVRAFHNARDAGAVRIEARISSSGSGIHLIAWFPELMHPAVKQRVREYLGDDPNRVKMDEERGGVDHTTQVLWTKKGDGEIETGFEDIWHALETIEQRILSVNPESVPKRFVNDGRKAVGRLAYPMKTPTLTRE